MTTVSKWIVRGHCNPKRYLEVCKMRDFENLLKGGDLRSIGKSNQVVELIDNQKKFDKLFELLFHPDRKIVMRTADAIEKITVSHPFYLEKHKQAIVGLCETAKDKELKWHLALLVSRLLLSKHEFVDTWQMLTVWATNKKESKIVRVNSLQALFDLLQQNKDWGKEFELIISKVNRENIPSLNARIKKLRNTSL